MLFAVGTKVRFRFTGETGVVTGRLEDDMLMVRLDHDPDFEIPAFEEDLLRDESREPHIPGARIVAGKTPREEEAPPRREIKAQYHILKPRGIQLAFEPMPGRDGSVSKYKLWLLNDTPEEFLFEFDFYTEFKDIIFLEDKISAASAVEMGDILYDDLSDNPRAFLSVRRITTEGVDEALEKQLTIRPKPFFNAFQTAPLLNVGAYIFVVLDRFTPPDKHNEEDLKSYTRRAKQDKPAGSKSYSTPFSKSNVEEFANFVPEIDLHIENLLNGHARLDRSEILRIQMQHFNRFMERAVRLGVPRVFIIHGLGEGILKQTVAQSLRNNPHVVKFKNEFHHKYGYGATEVIF